MSFYTLAKGVVGAILKPLFRIEVIGLENFPKEGGVLLCANHINNLDPPTVGITAPRPVSFMAKKELFHIPILKHAIRNLHAFPVKRGLADRGALRQGIKILKNGQVLGLFPEGTRSKTGEVGKGLAGAGFFALKTDASVVPCAIIGPYRPFKKLKVVYGNPIDMTELRKNKASAAEVTEVIMDSIRNLLEKYR